MFKNILGSQLILDFEHLPSSNFLTPNDLSDFFSNIFQRTNNSIFSQQLCLSKDVFTIIYTFPDFTFICHAFKNKGNLSFDISFHNIETDFKEKMEKFEELLCEKFGWQHNVTSIALNRTNKCQFYLNDGFHVGSIFKNTRLVERVESQYQDIRVFETEHIGKIMVLDGCVQICDELDDNYTLDMVKYILQEGREYQNVLILGAGDLVIPSYIVENLQNVKKITVVEIDEKVCKTVAKYFKFSGILDSEETRKKFTLKIEDGGKFVENAKNNKEIYDGVIIDCTDVDIEDAVASSLFNVPFYKNLRDIMAKGAIFSQQITDANSKKKFEKMIGEAGFVNPKFVFSETPEYSVSIPIGIVEK